MQYRDVLKTILEQYEAERNDRTGVGCFSAFNLHLEHDLESGLFPILTGRKMFPKSFQTEFEWFQKGETNIKRFQDAGVKIWDAWADEQGELGPVYGYQARNWNGENIDQINQVINDINNKPDSRRHIINLWNVSQLKDMKLPPCYPYMQFFVAGDKLHLKAIMRSADVFLGVPYDMALFSQILLYIAKRTGKQASKVSLTMVDAHIYKNQLSAVVKYLSQPIKDLPNYGWNGSVLLYNYQHGPVISCPVAV